VSEKEQILRMLDKTLALRPALNGTGEELWRAEVAMAERWEKLAAVVTEYGTGAIECLIAFLTAEPHFGFKYQPMLKELVNNPPGTPNDYDGNDCVRFWRNWLEDNSKPEYAQVDWRRICPRLARANDAYTSPGIEEQMRTFLEDDDSVVRYALARNPDLPEQTWSLLALSPEEDIRFELVSRRSCEPLVLKIFSEDPSPMIRSWVAWQPQTPPSALAHLARDTERTVRESLLRRESLPEPILSYLTDCGDDAIQEGAAKKLRVAAHRDELREAIFSRNVKTVEALLAEERSLAEVAYAGQVTALHLATLPPAKETAYLIVRALSRADARSNAPDALGYTPCQFASRAPQPIGAKMTTFLGCGLEAAPYAKASSLLVREPGETTETLNRRLESMFDRERFDLITATWQKLYERLGELLRRGGISQLQATAWQPQAADSVPFILHTQGMRERLLAVACGADETDAEGARKLLFEISKVPAHSQLAPHDLSRNPLFVWGGAVLDGLFTESELETAAESARAISKKNVRALDMMTAIGQLVALGHLVAQFVEEAPVEHFVRFCSFAGYHFKIASKDRVVADYVDPKWRNAFAARPSPAPVPIPVLEPRQLAVLPGRNDYLAYLKENELSEESVLGIVPELDAERRRKVNQVLMTALESGHEDLVKSVERASRSNTNVLLAEINRRLVLRFSEHAVVAAKDVYAGVFPTNTFNAHVVDRGAQPLILVNTGAFELLEGAVVPFSLLKPGSAPQQARVFAAFVRQYCEQRILPGAEQYEDFQFDEDRHKFRVHVLTAAEDFVLAHEYGHLASGHVGNAVADLPFTSGRSIQVPARQWDEEYEADRWAAHALISSATDPTSNEERVIICSGPLLFLSVAALVEGYHAKLGLQSDTHPPALSRYTEIREALAKAGFNRHTNLGATFQDFCAIVAHELNIPWNRNEGVTLVIDEMGRLVDDGLEAAVPILDQRSIPIAEKIAEKPRCWWQFWK